MKRSLSVVLAMLLLTSLIGCAASAEEQEPVTITVLTRYVEGSPDAFNEFYYQRIRQFEEENPNITVEDISVSELDVYNQRLKSSIAAGDYPDVFQNYGYSNTSVWVKNGLMRDMSEMMNDEDYTGPTNMSYFGPWDYSSKGIEGIYGIPTNVNVGTVFYINKKLLNSYGLEVPETWEDVYAMAPTLIENGITPIALSAGTKGRLAHFHTSLALHMFGLDLKDKLTTGQIKWTDEESLTVFEKFEEMLNAGLFGEDAISMDANGMQAAFLNGEAAMYPGMLSNATNSLALAETEGDVAMRNFFSFEDKPEYKDYWFVPAGDGLSIMTPETEPERLEAAERFVKFMVSQDSFDQQAIQNGVSVFPVTVDYDALGIETSPTMAAFLEDYNKIVGGCDEFDVYFDFTSSQEIFRTEIQTMFAGVDAASVAASIQAQYESAS